MMWLDFWSQTENIQGDGNVCEFVDDISDDEKNSQPTNWDIHSEVVTVLMTDGDDEDATLVRYLDD